MELIQLRPIGRLETPYRDKFGVPRQAGLAPSVRGRLVLEAEFRREEALRGIEECSHLWIVFLFDGVREEEVRLSVRPPRLGGNEKLGVFATRSPFRPNRIGISACRFHGFDHEADDGPALVLSGVDLMDGTTVIDVKPYLPYADSIPGAWSRLAPAAPEGLPVRVAEEASTAVSEIAEEQQVVILETLSLDGRPAFHEKQERPYFLRIFDFDVAWEVRNSECVLCGIRNMSERVQ